ncbi:MAG TPA: aldehyde dehydrogenase (NADP(+)) [Pirellulales bacterium]|nr:aldehyde dehydrogenase (NADP(+)) [Pirellulales bacterium]
MPSKEIQPVLLAGHWQPSQATGMFQSENPSTKQPLDERYPVSSWADCEIALEAAAEAAVKLQAVSRDTIARFLDRYAERIEQRAGEICQTAHQETGYPVSPRLADVELPRTTGQLRQAATAAREGSWCMATIDTKANIRSCFLPLGPICVFGPNNFPLAFGSISGGDFAAAIAAGNPVIAKANSSHPATTRLFAEEAQLAADECGLPPGTVQLLYRLNHEDGERLVADPRVGATGYTGGRSAGLKLKAAADAAGRPIYLELSSINPVVVLPGALAERAEKIADEFSTSCLMGTGQFCTNPGLVLLLAGESSNRFVAAVSQRFEQAPPGVLLSKSVAGSLEKSAAELTAAGAKALIGGRPVAGPAYRFANTLFQVDARTFLADPHRLQTEAFGNSSLLVVADDAAQAAQVIDSLEGNLTGGIYSDTSGSDDRLYDQLAPRLRRRVGRLLNDKMPTGVAVSPAMNHGGPYPATGHPGFTAVGMPASLHRFAMLACFDNVRPQRLPAVLQDKNPNGRMWRLIDGQWTQADVAHTVLAESTPVR